MLTDILNNHIVHHNISTESSVTHLLECSSVVYSSTELIILYIDNLMPAESLLPSKDLHVSTYV